MKYILATVMLGMLCTSLRAEDSIQQIRTKAESAQKSGNWKDAYESYRALVLNPQDDPLKVGEDLLNATTCLQNLGRTDETDDIREKAIEVHAKNWRLLSAAALNCQNDQHYGYVVAGKFSRGHHRGGGEYVMCAERDRTRALQLMAQAMELIKSEADKTAASNFYLQLANMLQNYNRESWRLQYLSELKELPDYEQWSRRYYGGGNGRGAPVDADGGPLFYKTPASWEAAKSDGERWRWALLQAMELNGANGGQVMTQFASFLRQQFDVITMSGYARANSGGEKDESGPYAVSTLDEDETIARLATGIKRFKHPDEFNFIKIFQQLAADKKNAYAAQASDTLAQIFEDRQQYVRAAEYWQQGIKDFGDPTNHRQRRLDQIVKNWGQFENIGAQPAGKNATFEYRFRNGGKVSFEAHAIKVDKLLTDLKEYIRTKPKQLEWDRMDIGNIGYRLVEKNQTQYLGEKVAAWDLELKPREKHLDRRITVETPLQKAGAYLLTATMADGNTSRIVIWLSDTVIVKKQLDKKNMYFVADAITGQPLNNVKLDFFGYQQQWNNNNVTMNLSEFAETSDANGFVFAGDNKILPQYQWMVTGANADGRLAFLGFSHVWFNNYYDQEYNQTKTFIITDRPVYRPDQAVKFKCWIGQAKYDIDGKSPYAGRNFTVLIHNPKGEKIYEKSLQTDEFGGLDGELTLGKDATLGQYNVQIVNMWPGGSFRLEEYKKPEYEVKVDAPTEPVMLGEKITATLNAKYYFGAPVADAKVKYKVTRYNHSANWYPAGAWDWFYNPGYWWFCGDYTWYPGFREWGCKRPYPWWYGARNEPPELVMENEVAIGADGKLKIEIDTGVAKALHGDTDHRYEITAEVTDQSRRTIVGTGNVMVARKPFSVYAWVDRGHYRVGDAIHASFAAQTLDNKPVKGAGKLALLKITYDKDNKPVETAVNEWPLDSDETGKAQMQIKASEPGQYRLSYKVADAKNHVMEGGYLFNIMGQGLDTSKFHFNNIELVTDKREYKPGEKVYLLINTDRADSTVLLFTRPANGVYQTPKILKLNGKSAIEEIEVLKRDMPNFFVEVVTISDGKYFSETRELVVPPENKVLTVDVKPSATEYKPGDKARVQVKLTDPTGEPFAGSAVVTIYDKSVEYIAGGSNVPEIKSHFWKWRRSHYEQTAHSLNLYGQPVMKSKEIGMQYLGAFGYAVAQMDGENQRQVLRGAVREVEEAGLGGGFGGGELRKAAAAPAAPKAANGAADAMEEKAAFKRDAADKSGGADRDGKEAQSEANAPVETTVRKNFADTAYWNAHITTNANGIAEFELPMPENLTTWKIKVWSMGQGTRVGQGETDVITKKNLIIRMQATRFFTQKDEVVLSANVHNYLSSKKKVQVVLEADGGCIELPADSKRGIEVEANGEMRIDFPVKVLASGEASIRMKALTDEESDAMEMKFPAYIHGMMKTESFANSIRPDKNTAALTFNVPAERREADSVLEVRYSPTLAGALVDALPYLVDYPYGCTEQTLNRFLPTVITQRVLNRMNVNLREVQQKMTNLNAQEIGNDVDRAKQWNRYGKNPVFDEQEVEKMVRAGIDRLGSMQCADGGWGWFSGWGEQSYPHTTAYVVHGLQIAKGNGVKVNDNMLQRGIQWLKTHQDRQVVMLRNAANKITPAKDRADNLDAFVYMVMADAGQKDAAMLDYLYRDRTNLAVYSKAMFGLALKKQNDKEKLNMIMQNIEQFLVQDEENQTAFLKLPEDNYWWYWYGSEYEAHAYYLKLLAATDPKSEKASRLVKYLINNRKHGSYWNSTRDTAVCIEAMSEYLTASGEDGPDMNLEITLDGKKVKETAINASNLFMFDNKLVLRGKDITSGQHTLAFNKKGKGPLYFNAYMTNFTMEDHIIKTGLEVKVDRKYYKLKRVEKSDKVQGAQGQALDQKVEKYERQELQELATLKSGDLVEIELEIDSKNDYEYLLFEDMKAAGFEPVDVRSGYTRNGMNAYMELRDERVCFFVQRLARGKHSIAYRMRAEIPGKFNALPTKAWAMYAPELKANSDEIKLHIRD